MYITNVRVLAQGAIGITLPAEMVHKHQLEEGKAIIRPLPNGSFNVVFMDDKTFNETLKKMGGLG